MVGRVVINCSTFAISAFIGLFYEYDATQLNIAQQHHSFMYEQLYEEHDPVFRGGISQSAVEQFISLIENTGGVNHVYINSPGGDELASILLANYLNNNNISASAYRQCSSSCFQIVLLSNWQPKIVEGTRILVHQSSFGLTQLYNVDQMARYDWSQPLYSHLTSVSERTNEIFKDKPYFLRSLTRWTLEANLQCLRRTGRHGRPVWVFANRGRLITTTEILSFGITFVDRPTQLIDYQDISSSDAPILSSSGDEYVRRDIVIC